MARMDRETVRTQSICRAGANVDNDVRAAERYNDTTPDEHRRRRERGWGPEDIVSGFAEAMQLV